MQLRGARDGNDPRLLRQQPGERDLSRRRLLPSPDCAEQIDHGLVCLPSLRRKTRNEIAEVGTIECRGLVDLSREEALPQRTKWNEADAEPRRSLRDTTPPWSSTTPCVGPAFELPHEVVKAAPVDRLESPSHDARQPRESARELEVERESCTTAVGLDEIAAVVMIEGRAFYRRVFHQPIGFEDQDLFVVCGAEPRANAPDRSHAIAMAAAIADMCDRDLQRRDAFDVGRIGERIEDDTRRARQLIDELKASIALGPIVGSYIVSYPCRVSYPCCKQIPHDIRTGLGGPRGPGETLLVFLQAGGSQNRSQS